MIFETGKSGGGIHQTETFINLMYSRSNAVIAGSDQPVQKKRKKERFQAHRGYMY